MRWQTAEGLQDWEVIRNAFWAAAGTEASTPC